MIRQEPDSQDASGGLLDRRVPLIAAVASLSSGGALALTIVTHRPLWLASTFVFVPGLIALVGLSVLLRRDQQSLFLARLKAGLIAGTVGVAAYDTVRWVIESSHLASTHSFIAISIFGSSLTGRPTTNAIAIVAGWGFHLTNGVGFALAYSFVAAGRSWRWGVLWGLALEAVMVSMYPGWLGIRLGAEFLSVSVLAHVAYGAAVGRIVERSL